MMSQNPSLLLALLAMAACGLAALGIDQRAGASVALGAAAIPFICTLLAAVASQWRSARLLWVTTGTLSMFVLLTLWSIGSYFAPAAGLLIAAGVLQLKAGPRVPYSWSLPVLFMLGVTGLCAVAVIRANLQEYEVVSSGWSGSSVSVRNIELPLIIRVGATMFPLTVMLAIAPTLRRFCLRRNS